MISDTHIDLGPCEAALQNQDFQAALNRIKPILLDHPNASSALNMLGVINLYQNGFPEALSWFKAAILAEPLPETTSLLNFGMAQELLDQTSAAISTYKSLMIIAPSYNKGAAKLARLFFLQDRFEECLNILRTFTFSEFDHFYMRGICYLRTGRTGKSISNFKTALELRGKTYPEALDGLAEALSQLGRFDELVKSLSPIENLEDFPIDARYFLGSAYLSLGNRGQAERHLLAVTNTESKHAISACRSLGGLYFDAQHFKQAEEYLLRVLEVRPHEFPSLEKYGDCLIQRNQFPDAVAFAEETLRNDPPLAAHWNMLCVLLKTAQDRESSALWFETAVQKFPEEAVLYFNYGHLLNELSRPDQAQIPLRKSILLDPGYAKAINALCITHCMKHLADYALILVNRALLISPNMATAWLNRGILFKTMGEFSNAVAAMYKSLELNPDDLNTQGTLAYTLMQCGELEAGFKLYDSRWAKPDFPSPKRPFPQPIWKGHPIENGKLLLYMEQGMGDEIMFSWYLPHVSKDIDNIVVDCDERLIPLFERSFPAITFVPRNIKNPHSDTLKPDILFKAPIGHVMKFYWYETRLHINQVAPIAQKTFAQTDGYLKVDPDRARHWRTYLDQFPKDRLKVGICWRSSVKGRHRDVQYLQPEEIARPFDERFAVFNLQYDHLTEETDIISQELTENGALFETPPDIDLRNDLDDLTALTKELDIVVTPLISTAFMAAAVGTPTFVFRCNEQDKIWQNLGTDFVPWLPSIKLFFRAPTEPWDDTISKMKNALSDVADLPDWGFTEKA